MCRPRTAVTQGICPSVPHPLHGTRNDTWIEGITREKHNAWPRQSTTFLSCGTPPKLQFNQNTLQILEKRRSRMETSLRDSLRVYCCSSSFRNSMSDDRHLAALQTIAGASDCKFDNPEDDHDSTGRKNPYLPMEHLSSPKSVGPHAWSYSDKMMTLARSRKVAKTRVREARTS